MAVLLQYVDGDWSVDRQTGDIRYLGADHDGTDLGNGSTTPSYVTVLQFHRFLQDLADNASSTAQDELDITDTDPSSRSTNNIISLKGNYNIDYATSQHIYNGSIKQTISGNEEIYAGFVNFGNTPNIQIIQDGAVLADPFWNEIYDALAADPTASFPAGVSHQFILKVKDAGVDIDNRKVIGTSRNFGQTYSEFEVSSAGEGNNVLALSEVADLNNATAVGTVAGYTGITNTTEGYNLIDVDNNGVDETYYSEWDANTPTNSINDLYERAKWLTREGSTSTLYGLNGELFRGITHELTHGTLTGTFDEGNPVTWTGGTGQVLASNGSNKLWIQLLTGTAPASGTLISQSVPDAASATTNADPAPRNLSFPFIGQSTGSAIIGGFGVGIQTNDLTNNDTLFDLTNTSVNPPNNVTFTVGGIVSGQDYVLVAPASGTDVNGDPAIDVAQMSLSTTLNTDNITSVVVNSIPSDTPSSGTIRVKDDDDLYRRLVYTSYTGSTFTIDPAASEAYDATTANTADFLSGTQATSGNQVYISYIDKLATSVSESYTAVYNTDRSLVVIVRDGGVSPIKQFISAATFGSSNTTVTAIRTSDL